MKRNRRPGRQSYVGQDCKEGDQEGGSYSRDPEGRQDPLVAGRRLRRTEKQAGGSERKLGGRSCRRKAGETAEAGNVGRRPRRRAGQGIGRRSRTQAGGWGGGQEVR